MTAEATAAVPGPPGPLRIAPDARWWPAVADLVCELARAAPGPAGARDLRAVVVIVASPWQAPALRAALHARLGGAAFVAPRIATLEQWAGGEGAERQRRRAELFRALRDSAWVRERFGAQAGALWALAGDIAQLGDELTLAASGAVDAFAGRWRAAVARVFSERAAAAGDAQVELVLQLWRAGLSRDGAAARLRARLEQLARNATGPLAWLAPQGGEAWQIAYCLAHAQSSGHPAWLVEADRPAFVAAHPWLAAAWPELAGPADAPPLAARAQAIAGTGVAPPAVTLLRCASLEEEAHAAAAWTVARLEAGCASVALVALDRLAARRVRALLDRAGVLVADESGWKLSTTSAAAAVMRWIDLVAGDFAARELLDWVRSPFTLAGAGDKTALAARIELALVEEGVLSGAQAVRAALARRAHGGDEQDVAAARLVGDAVALAREWQRPGPLGRYLGLLAAALDGLGMRPALDADPVGRLVLAAIEQLHDALIGADLPAELGEFRALLAAHFEELGTGDRAIDSPVVMTTLAGTRLRRFDAALLIGADADRLPAGEPVGGLLADTVRRELGLRTAAERRREQALDLACLLAVTAAPAATWRCRRDDEPIPLSPLLDRLALVIELAKGTKLATNPAIAARAAAALAGALRRAAAPGRLPARISASAYQDLVDCPYRFFGLRVLGLRESERLRPTPDKRDFGVLLHAVLFRFHRDTEAGEQRPALERLQGIVDSLLAPLLVQRPTLLAYRQRLREVLPGYLAWDEQSRRDGWRWQAGELSLRRELALPSGATVQLQGRIDRIDADAQGRRRILDYKTREASSLRRDQRDPGEEVQLPFYGLLLEPPPDEAAYLSVQRPADPRRPERGGVRLVAGPAPVAEHAAGLARRMAEDLGRIEAGAAMAAIGAEETCRRCELRSLCRHAFTTVPGAGVP